MKSLSFCLVLLAAALPAFADPTLKSDAPDNVKTYWATVHQEKSALSTQLNQALASLQQQAASAQSNSKPTAKSKKAAKPQGTSQLKSDQQQIKDCNQDIAKVNNPSFLPPISVFDVASALKGVSKDDVASNFGYVTGAIGDVGADRLNSKTRAEDALEVLKIIDGQNFVAKVHFTTYADIVTRDDRVGEPAAGKSSGNTSTLDQPVWISDSPTKALTVGANALRGKAIEVIGTKDYEGKTVLHIKPFEIKKYLQTSTASTQPAAAS